jgi:hypothetical protein
MKIFVRKNILLSFSVLCALLLSACSMDPDVEITEKNVKDAVSSLPKADAAKVAALGGDKYLLGKTSSCLLITTILKSMSLLNMLV